VSSHVSTAVYFVSIFSLLLLLARPVALAYSASQERSAQVVAGGLAATIDSMSPGTSFLIALTEYPGVQLSVSLAGQTVSASFGSERASAQVRWELTRESILPGQEYNFTLKGDALSIAPARDD